MTAEWRECEDCLGSGGRVECGTCGGSGSLPANADARGVERQREADRREWAMARAARAYDEPGPVDAEDV